MGADLLAGGGVVYLRIEKKSPRQPSLTGAAVPLCMGGAEVRGFS